MVNDDREADVSLEAFSKVVEAIYDCALDPDHWHHTLRRIAELCESQCGGLGVHDYLNGQTELAFQFGYDLDEFERTHEGTCKGMNPFFAPLQLLPVGAVATRAMLVDDDEFLESRFYREWAKPQRLLDAITLKCLHTEQRTGLLAIQRLEPYPRYADSDVRLLTLLSPHICRAVAISDALNLKTIRLDALEATLDSLASGVYLADRHARIVFMNRAAERQAKTSNALRIENNRLEPVDRLARTAMSSAIAKAISDGTDEGADGAVTLALPGDEGMGLVAIILPLARGARRSMYGASDARIAVFVQDPVVAPPFPGEAFAKLYGLTGGELRVLLAIAPGLGIKEAANMLGISETTAKTHLQRIYAKTGTTKQTELLHLFMRSAPPVRVT
jgi:DNA-binding CsgD family transcriptional regulator/PAS domain-containing protein